MRTVGKPLNFAVRSVLFEPVVKPRRCDKIIRRPCPPCWAVPSRADRSGFEDWELQGLRKHGVSRVEAGRTEAQTKRAIASLSVVGMAAELV